MTPTHQLVWRHCTVVARPSRLTSLPVHHGQLETITCQVRVHVAPRVSHVNATLLATTPSPPLPPAVRGSRSRAGAGAPVGPPAARGVSTVGTVDANGRCCFAASRPLCLLSQRLASRRAPRVSVCGVVWCGDSVSRIVSLASGDVTSRHAWPECLWLDVRVVARCCSTSHRVRALYS